MQSNLVSPKNLVALIAGVLMLACSAVSCVGFAGILLPPATGYLEPSVIIFAIFLMIIAPLLLLISIGLLAYFGLQARKESQSIQEEEN